MIIYCPDTCVSDSTINSPQPPPNNNPTRHNDLLDIQGGNTSERFHLTRQQQLSLISTKVQKRARVVGNPAFIKLKYPLYVGNNFMFIEVYDGDNLIDKSHYSINSGSRLGIRTTTLSDTIKLENYNLENPNNVTVKYYEIEISIKPHFVFGRNDGRNINLRTIQNKFRDHQLKELEQIQSSNIYKLVYGEAPNYIEFQKRAPDYIKLEDLPFMLYDEFSKNDQDIEIYIRGRNTCASLTYNKYHYSQNPVGVQSAEDYINIRNDNDLFNYQIKRNIFYLRLRNTKYNIVTDQVKLRRLRCTFNNRNKVTVYSEYMPNVWYFSN